MVEFQDSVIGLQYAYIINVYDIINAPDGDIPGCRLVDIAVVDNMHLMIMLA